MAKTKLFKPFKGSWKCTSDFGPRDLNKDGVISGILENHKGIDVALTVGVPLYAIENGTVSFAGAIDYVHQTYRDRNGNRPFINNGPNQGVSIQSSKDGNFSTYMHMSRVDVKSGQKVKGGQIIGLSGNSGASYAPHLHFELTSGGRPFGAGTNPSLAGINAVYPHKITFPGNSNYEWLEPDGSKPAPTVISTKPKKTAQQIKNEQDKIMFEQEKHDILNILAKPEYKGTGLDDGNSYGYLRGLINKDGANLSKAFEQVLRAYKEQYDKPAQTTTVARDLTEAEINQLPQVLALNKQLQTTKAQAKIQPVVQEIKEVKFDVERANIGREERGEKQAMEIEGKGIVGGGSIVGAGFLAKFIDTRFLDSVNLFESIPNQTIIGVGLFILALASIISVVILVFRHQEKLKKIDYKKVVEQGKQAAEQAQSFANSPEVQKAWNMYKNHVSK